MKRKPDPWINYLLCLVLILGFILSSFLSGEGSTPVYSPLDSPKVTELRGVWLTNTDSNILFNPNSLPQIIRRLAQTHFNTLYPVVWSRGYSFYPSGVAAERIGATTYPGLGFLRWGSDALRTTVNEGHRQRIKVVPWFEGGFAIPVDSPLVQRYPGWISQDVRGKKVFPLNKLAKDFALKPSSASANAIATGWQSPEQKQKWVWLNPINADVQQFIKGLILEVVRSYDIDGIQLDENFSWPVNLGYDPFTIYLYQREHGGKSPPTNPQDPEWMAWRAAKLTAFVADISKSVKAIKPNLTISLASQNAASAYQHYLQDWKTWVNQGLFNELNLKIYQDDMIRFQAQLDEPDLRSILQQIPVGIGILAGTWNHPVEIQTLVKQVEMVRQRGFAGFSFYNWESLWGYITPDAPQRRRDVFNALFVQRALPPTFRRKQPLPQPPATKPVTKR